MNKLRRFIQKPSLWLPLAATALVIMTVVVGYVHLYAQQDALNTASLRVKSWFSVVVDPQIEDTDNNLVPAAQYGLLGPIESKDGGELFSFVSGASEEPCWGNVVGSPNASPEYISTAWVEHSPSLEEVSLWTGTRDNPADPLVLAIREDVQQAVFEALESYGVDGTVLAWDESGHIQCMVSSSKKYPENNLNLHTLSPGSIMKPITLLLCELQGVDTTAHSLVCTGSYTLQDGSVVHCSGTHGLLQGGGAGLAKSCNCFFASMIETLDPNATRSLLLEMGFDIRNGEETLPGREVFTGSQDIMYQLPRAKSTLVIKNTFDFESTFNLIGQTSNDANPVHLLWVLSAIMEGKPQMAVPALDSSSPPVYQPLLPSQDPEIVQAALEKVSTAWQQAYLQYDDQLYGHCSICKTGTTQLGADGETVAKRLAGQLTDGTYFLISATTKQTAIPAELAKVLAQSLAQTE